MTGLLNLISFMKRSIGGGLYGPRNLVHVLDPFSSNVHGAYSLRLLLSDYTGPLIRLRRDSDDEERDFFRRALTLDLDTFAVNNWLAGAGGFVVKWYDQSGNARDFDQNTAADQPQYVSDSQNGHPTIDTVGNVFLERIPTGSDALWDITNSVWNIVTNPVALTSARIYNEANDSNNNTLHDYKLVENGILNHFVRSDAGGSALADDDGTVDISGAMHVLTVTDANGTSSFRVDGVVDASHTYSKSGTLTIDHIAIGGIARPGLSFPVEMSFVEMIILDTVPDVSVTSAIEADQKSYWGTP